MKKTDEDKISEVARMMRGARSLMFVTGAGISRDSGLPTYRGIGGIYDDKLTEDGMPIETALSGEMLRLRPEVTWKYLSQIEEKNRCARFNRGHAVIAEIEKHFERVLVLTQNVDGFHLDAGSRNVIEIHGNLHHLFCPACGWRTEVKDFSGIEIPPLCPQCQKWVRPDVVFFGEMLPPEKLEYLFVELERGFDLYFSIGTTSVFPYIQQPILIAKRMGRSTVEINPSRTEISDIVDVKIPMGAAEALAKIWDVFQSAPGTQ